ncbi:MAG TPA: hypothetical protein V6C72_00810 [Chroococcales cyanobacterium]
MKRNKGRGQSIVELCVGIIVLIPIVLVVFDLAVIVIGVQINDSTCREAARIAASGQPTAVDANQRAQAVIDRANNRSKGMLSNFKLVSVTLNNINGAQLAQAQQYGGAVSGTVTVQTQVQIRPFVVSYVYNGSGPMVFGAKQTFPFTYVYQNTAAAAAPS